MENQGPRAVSGIIEELKKKYDNARLADAVALIIKLFENIESNPAEVKFRQAKRTNPTLQQKLFCFTGIERIFTALGFYEDGEFYRFTQQSITPISQGLILLRGQEVQLRMQHPQNEDVKKRLAEVDAEYKIKEFEKAKLLDAMKRDREEKKAYLKDHPAQSSQANKMNFGSKMVTRKDLDPTCDDKKGG